ncbi:hypothetical protein E2C01_047337 [Portunus trituberculatus]|uniref:Uncharacterized protein n=1 Tax=Portunus trituberculatus TaxID=210409 RepID=A0A5B7G7G3_PORTR|nr:hypothetical protein [Portunus trituberculatus]
MAAVTQAWSDVPFSSSLPVSGGKLACGGTLLRNGKGAAALWFANIRTVKNLYGIVRAFRVWVLGHGLRDLCPQPVLPAGRWEDAKCFPARLMDSLEYSTGGSA